MQVIADGVTPYDLGRPLFQGMPQSPNHPQFWHALPRRHGDMVREDGGSAANDLIFMGTHVGTHIDALAHVSHDGSLHDGQNAYEASVGGKFMELGVHTVPPMICRGVLLDIPMIAPQGELAPGYEITVADLDAEVARSSVVIERGDVILVRSGWGARFNLGSEAYVGHSSGVPGVSEAGAHWLADHNPIAVGADTIAFERLAPGGGHSLLPAHRVL
ncbi:MAG: cyclase family protein, partial [Ferrimicrobium sp.]